MVLASRHGNGLYAKGKHIQMGAVYFPLDRSTVISKIYITSEALCLKHSIQNFKASQRPATNEQ